MLEVAVTVCALDKAIPPYETVGFVPFAESPLAVTRSTHWDALVQAWKNDDDPSYWRVTHRATGLQIGDSEWAFRDDAFAFLLRLDPDFAAWSEVREGVPDAAMLACRVKFRLAMEAIGGAA